MQPKYAYRVYKSSSKKRSKMIQIELINLISIMKNGKSTVSELNFNLAHKTKKWCNVGL